MKAKFEGEHEVDLVDAPDGWRWVGTIGHRSKHVSLQSIVIKPELLAIGTVVIYEYGVSAGYTPTDGPYQWLGEFSDTRAASVALVKALGLEVAP